MTYIERIMAKALKRAHLKFVNEYTIYEKGKKYPKYRLDFAVFGNYCRIDVECDSTKYHSKRKDCVWDASRNLWLKTHGWDDILRFSEKRIKYDISSCINEIVNVIKTNDENNKRKLEQQVVDIHNLRKPEPQLAFNTAEILNRVIKNSLYPVPKITLESYCHEVYLKRIKKGLLNGQLKVNEQLLSFPFPWLNDYISKKTIDFYFLCYNLPFVVKLYLKPGAVRFTSDLLCVKIGL